MTVPGAMVSLVDELCSPKCAGRKPGTPGGREARRVVVEAFRAAGLDPSEQEVPWCKGANVIATIAPEAERFVVVGAHFDHLGKLGGDVYRGADDNAAAVAILAEVGRGLARARPEGRGVILAAFDGEESPYFLTDAMGSARFVQAPPVPLDRLDMMVCMDLCGHAFGGEGVPSEVRRSLFALGAERSAGTAAHVARLAQVEEGVIVRPMDAEIIPPLSDYISFWRRGVPFLFLSSGRASTYHTPQDTPELLDYPKMAATARWLERFVRETCARPEPRIAARSKARDDASTLRSIIAITAALTAVSDEAAVGQRMAEELLADCDAEGRLPDAQRMGVEALVGMLESRLA